MNITVVVPNWNGADFIRECLESLRTQTQQTNVIVVDNGSIDESVEIIVSDFPEVTLLKQPKNLGFAGGVNVGIRYALNNNADAVALFNNDAVADKNWLKSLVSALRQNDSAGITTSKLMLTDKTHLDSTGDFCSIYGIPFPRGRNQADTGQYDEPEEVFAASGGASLYRATMLEEIGYFDERFFAYFEDVDISFRAQLAGWKVLYEPKAIAYHRLSATSSKLGSFSHYHSTKNFLMLYLKNMPTTLYWKYMPFFIYQFMRTTAASIIHLKLVSYFKGVGFFIVHIPDLLISRWRIQKSKVIETKKIDDLLYKKRPPKIPKL